MLCGLLLAAVMPVMAAVDDSFPLLGVKSGNEVYVSTVDFRIPPSKLFAYEIPDVGGVPLDGYMKPFVVSLRNEKPEKLDLGEPVVGWGSSYFVYEGTGDQHTQQNFVLLFVKPDRVEFTAKSTLVELSTGDEVWRLRYVPQDEDYLRLFVQRFFKGRCTRTRKYRVSMGDASVPVSSLEGTRCGKVSQYP